MMMEALAEELDSEDEDEMKDEAKVEASDPFEYETQENGLGIGSITRPTSLCFPGLSAGGEGAIMMQFLIDDEEKLVEEERRLAFEVMHYEMLLKRARLNTEGDEIQARQALARGNLPERLLGLAVQRRRSSSSPSRDAQGGRGRY